MQIERIDWNTPNNDEDPTRHVFRLHFRESGYASVLSEPGMFARYTPQPGDYYVVYRDGYKSISPRKEFEDGYTRI